MEWDSRKIKALRKHLNLTQPQLAELLGTSQVLISYWETDRRRPCSISQAALTFLAELKGVKLESFDSATDRRRPCSISQAALTYLAEVKGVKLEDN